MEILKQFIIAIGGGTTSLIALLTIFKSLFVKLFEKSVDSVFEKNLERYKNKLTRTTTAYEMLLNKELEFYDKIDPLYAELIVLFQDLIYYSDSKNGFGANKQWRDEKYKDYVLRFFELIIETKKEVLVYQVYVPNKIFGACLEVVKEMQQSVEHWTKVGEVLFTQSDEIIDSVKSEEISDAILKDIVLAQVLIKERLNELSTAE